MKCPFVLVAAVLASLYSDLACGQTAVTRPIVSEEACPLEVIKPMTRDGQLATAVVRRPPGKGPFPAVVLLHGGLKQRQVEGLRRNALRQPTSARLLAAGFVTVNATFRSRDEDPQTRDALVDCLAIIEHVRKMPEVDSKSVVVFGGSGGGSLALEQAGETPLAAVAAGEPASILFTGMHNKETRNRQDRNRLMSDPKQFYTPELKKFTRDKIKQIACPILIVDGDKHPINKINHEIIIPELKQAEKDLKVILYPGQPHGFYNGDRGTPAAGQKCFVDMQAFFKKHCPTKPVALGESLIRRVAVGSDV